MAAPGEEGTFRLFLRLLISRISATTYSSIEYQPRLDKRMSHSVPGIARGQIENNLKRVSTLNLKHGTLPPTGRNTECQ